MIACLILSHGQIAAAIQETCLKITGQSERIYTMGCEGHTPKSLEQDIVHLIQSENLTNGLFIFVSLKGGSCWNASARLIKDYDNIQLISGLSLPLILSFVTKRDKYNFDELGEIIVKDGMRGIDRWSSSNVH